MAIHRGLVRGRCDTACRFWLCRKQPGEPCEVVGGHRQDEARSNAFEATVDSLRHAADGLGPAEGLLDPFAVLLGQRVARVPRGAPIDGRMAGLLRHMRGDAGLSEVADEVGAVVSFVRAERQPPRRAGRVVVDHAERCTTLGLAVCTRQVALDDQARAVLHQGMPHEAQDGPRARRLAVEPCVGVRGRDMRRVRALRAAEVDVGVAACAVGLGHRISLGRRGGAVGIGGVGVLRRSAGTIAARRLVPGLRLEALHRSPGLH